MKDIQEYESIIKHLGSISENPNFSDSMRNSASELCYYIKGSLKPLEPLKISNQELLALSNYFFNKDMTKDDFEKAYCREVIIID